MSEQRNLWEQRYAGAGDDYLFGTAPSRFVERHFDSLAGCRRVLSIADGEGRNSVWLAEQGFAVTATEISPAALAKARKLAAGRHVAVELIEADILDWAWPQAAFDAVLGVFIQFLSPAQRQQVFAAMAAALKPGGMLLVHGYTPKQLDYKTGGPSVVENLYTGERLRAELAGMEILELREYEEEIAEGSAHQGRSALIDVVARKPAGR